MSDDNDFGCNEYTPQKQEDFRGYLDIILPAVVGMLKKYPDWACPYFLYYDITGGPGQYQFDGQEIIGSPLIFVQEAQKYNLPYLAEVIEKDDINYQRLNALLGHKENVTVWHGDHNQVLPRLWNNPEQKCYGLLYADPKGIKEFTGIFDLLDTMSRMKVYKLMDILLYIHAAAWKRTRIPNDYPYLEEQIRRINKRKRIIRQPLGKQQHTFVLLSNWIKMPVWKRRGFFDINSPEGQQIFDIINLTDDELSKKKQPELFQLTEPMPSI